MSKPLTKKEEKISKTHIKVERRRNKTKSMDDGEKNARVSQKSRMHDAFQCRQWPIKAAARREQNMHVSQKPKQQLNNS